MQSPIAQPGLVAEFAARLPAMLDELGDLVRCESPSGDVAALQRSAEAVAALGQRLTGCAPELIADAGPTHLRWTFGTGPRRVLLVGHHDTVWPLGSLQDHPWSVADGVARGGDCGGHFHGGAVQGTGDSDSGASADFWMARVGTDSRQ